MFAEDFYLCITGGQYSKTSSMALKGSAITVEVHLDKFTCNAEINVQRINVGNGEVTSKMWKRYTQVLWHLTQVLGTGQTYDLTRSTLSKTYVIRLHKLWCNFSHKLVWIKTASIQ